MSGEESEGIKQTSLEIFRNACKNGEIDVVKRFLEDDDLDFDLNGTAIDPDRTIGYTGFNLACKYNKVDVVRLLLDDPRIDVNKVSEGLESPFYHACSKGHYEIVKLLVEDMKVDINKPDNWGDTPFLRACMDLPTNIEVIQLLIDDNRIDINRESNTGRTSFSSTCENGNLIVAKMFLENPRFIFDSFQNNVQLINACEDNNFELIKLLLNDDRFDPNYTPKPPQGMPEKNEYGESISMEVTAFHIICAFGGIPGIELFLEDERVDQNKCDNSGLTALYYAFKYNTVDIVKFLIKESKINIEKVDSHGMTLFHHICKDAGDLGIVSDIEINDENEYIPRPKITSITDIIEIIEYMFKHCDNITIPNVTFSDEVNKILEKYR